MYALRLQTIIPESRRLVVSLPADAPTGAAEVIILTSEAQSTGNSATILKFLAERQWQPGYRRTAAEIDRQIQEEREAWE